MEMKLYLKTCAREDAREGCTLRGLHPLLVIGICSSGMLAAR